MGLNNSDQSDINVGWTIGVKNFHVLFLSAFCVMRCPLPLCSSVPVSSVTGDSWEDVSSSAACNIEDCDISGHGIHGFTFHKLTTENLQ